MEDNNHVDTLNLVTSKTNIMYVGIMVVLYIVMSFLSNAKFDFVTEFFSAVVSEFNIIISLNDLKSAMINMDVLWMFMMLQLQYQFLLRVIGKYLDNITLCDKILSFIGSCILQVYLAMNYATYSVENWNCCLLYTILVFYGIIIIDLIRSIKKGIQVDFPYFVLFYVFVCFFTNPFGRGWFAVLIGYLLEIGVYILILIGLESINLSVLFLPIALVTTFLMNKVSDWIVDKIILNFSQGQHKTILGKDCTWTDILCFIFGFAMCVFWFVATVLGVTFPDIE